LDPPVVERCFVAVFKVQSLRNVTGCVMLLCDITGCVMLLTV